MDTFIKKCSRGELSHDDIDNHVDQWHEGASDQPLHTFSGMTREEYGAWVANPDTLLSLLDARRSVRA